MGVRVDEMPQMYPALIGKLSPAQIADRATWAHAGQDGTQQHQLVHVAHRLNGRTTVTAVNTVEPNPTGDVESLHRPGPVAPTIPVAHR